ncbi:DUF3817 domain-containing protein [Pendulispora brunnea]|uniref:DUF3817 domain-containing protein n=1 Tax=Pendulispora brunnea TaxID=2905690 RepID=A0ABZ2KBY2_9BACT
MRDEWALAWLRAVALLEGISLLVLLFVAMPLKYLAGMVWIVQIAGSVALVASLVPFGAFFLDRALRREADG